MVSKPSKREQYRIRSRVLTEWRGIYEPRDTSRFEHNVSEILPGIVRQLGLKDAVDAESITAAWKEMVGDYLAANSRPVSLKNRVLTLGVLQSTLLYMLEQEFKPQIMEKVRARFGTTTVREIRFVVG